jgi:O-antigen/teichoic acid export membrane protein
MRQAASGTYPPRSQSSVSHSDDAGQDLIRRAPSGYIWNQLFSIWLYISLLLYELVVRRSLPLNETGVWDLASTAANLGIYVASLGLTSAGAVYLPRMLAEGGPAQAMAVALRLVLTRLAAVALVALAILWGLPALAALLAPTGLPGVAAFSQSLNDQKLLAHRVVIAGMVVGTGMANLLAALLTALLRTRTVFVVGGVAQLLVVALAYVFIKPLGGGADGALSALVLPAAVAAVIYAIVIRRVLAAPPAAGHRALMGPMLRLGLASWLADLANAAFFKPLALYQLAAYVSLAQIPLFSSVFQLGHGAALVVLTGVSGVSIAILSAAYANRHLGEMATAWRAISKLQVLLTIPLMAFLVPHGTAIMRVLFGRDYSSAGGLLAIFLTLNILVQLCGATAHEAALYVLGQQNWVVASRWGSLGLLWLADVLLIPRYGVGGALVAVALAQLAAALFLLALALRAVKGPYPVGFIVKIVAALLLPVGFSVLWRPSSLVGLVLAGLGYAVIFVACLRFIRPLDAEDGLLLNRVAAPLRALLRPFVAPARPGAPLTAPPAAGTALGNPPLRRASTTNPPFYQ